jgi:endonuclease/exonuclease/phosphatase family metal-dependent hydrolase
MTGVARRTAVAAVSALLGSASLICANGDTTCAARRGTLVGWIRTAPPGERAAIDRWCAGVGPPVRITTVRRPEVLTGRFAIATWNVHVDGGNLEQFVTDLVAGRLTGGAPVDGYVLLLQEVYRAGADVPSADPARMEWASPEGRAAASGAREDIGAAARRLGLDLIYVPSMRNGGPAATDEDRGNAIASTVPLAGFRAIELPLERQRRVAVQATVRARGAGGVEVPVTVVDTHFTNMVRHHLWLLSEAGRLRQAQALGGALPPDGALVVGGDFNAWFGFHDAAYRELAAHAAPSPDQDRRASFGPLRLDHVLFRLPPGWTTTVRRAEQRYGSDHYPLVALVEPR